LTGGRVLDAGCGDGALVSELRAHGFDAAGIDKREATAPHCTQCAIEDYVAPAPFDAAVARLSLHHVANLGVAFARIRAALVPGAPFVLQEFGWTNLSRAGIAWVRENAPGFGPDPHTVDLWSDSEQDVERRWVDRYGELHGMDAMLFAFDAYFHRHTLRVAPYYAWLIGWPELAEAERVAIAEGRFPSLGFICIGKARADGDDE
jgi:SAM-dependent methyltransferase